MTNLLRTLILVIGLLWPALALAFVIPAGTEFQVNTYTTLNQFQAAVCSALSPSALQEVRRLLLIDSWVPAWTRGSSRIFRS